MSKKSIPVVAAVFYRLPEGQGPEVGLFRRKSSDSGAGSWEFPGGKVDKGETEILALQREIFEELNLRIKVEDKIGISEFDYGTKKISLTAYFVKAESGEESPQFQLVDHDASKWVSEQEIKIDELAPADRPLVAEIFKRLKKAQGKK